MGPSQDPLEEIQQNGSCYPIAVSGCGFPAAERSVLVQISEQYLSILAILTAELRLSALGSELIQLPLLGHRFLLMKVNSSL